MSDFVFKHKKCSKNSCFKHHMTDLKGLVLGPTFYFEMYYLLSIELSMDPGIVFQSCLCLSCTRQYPRRNILILGKCHLRTWWNNLLLTVFIGKFVLLVDRVSHRKNFWIHDPVVGCPRFTKVLQKTWYLLRVWTDFLLPPKIMKWRHRWLFKNI